MVSALRGTTGHPWRALCIGQGNADPLNSTFHISFNMTLNTTRVEGNDPELIIRNSFLQFQSMRSLPAKKKGPAEWMDGCVFVALIIRVEGKGRG